MHILIIFYLYLKQFISIANTDNIALYLENKIYFE